MRRTFSLLVAAAAVLACSKGETGAADSAAAVPAGPAPLTAAALAGTWTGQSMAEGSDTATARWTAIATEASAEVKLVDQTSPNDTVIYTRSLDADSSMATSAPFTPKNPPRMPQVINRSVARIQDGKLVGTYTMVLASKPDSVVSRGRFEATKNP